MVAELPLILLIANTAHPLDPRPHFSCGRLQVLSWHGDPVTVDRSPEMERAVLNTTTYLAAR
jgi:hypothetical protein